MTRDALERPLRTDGSRGRGPRHGVVIVALIIDLAFSAALLGLAYHRATGVDCAMTFYPATIPTMVQAGLAALAAGTGLVWRRARKICLAVSGLTLALVALPALYAMGQWPGGDDGGAFGWMFIVGGGCVVSFFVGGGSLAALASGSPAAEERHPEV
jgi:hypothetical protein